MVQLTENTAEEVKDPIRTNKDTGVPTKESGGVIWAHSDYPQS